jgi:hypothetical protein
MREKMVHRIPDRADEQSKEAEIVPLLTPPRTIWIDWSTGEICTPEPIEPGGQLIPFTAPRLAWKDQTPMSGIRDEVLLNARTPLFDVPLKRTFDRRDVAIACGIGTASLLAD